MHCGLWALGLLVRLGLVRSLTPITGPLLTIAGWLYPFGSDRGGMRVDVAGTAADGTKLARRWTLIAEAGDGPEIPATPAYLMVRKALAGQVEPGARACLMDLSLNEIEAGLEAFAITTGRA